MVTWHVDMVEWRVGMVPWLVDVVVITSFFVGHAVGYVFGEVWDAFVYAMVYA